MRHTTANRADPHLATEPPRRLGDVARRLLIAHVYQPEGGLMARLVQRVEPVPAESCHEVHAMFLQFAHE
jgi:hypothetical protein